MHIRAASADELDAVLALWAQAEALPTHTDDIDALARLVERDPGALLVAVDGARVVGSVIAAWDGWRGSIYRLAVAPAARRAGLASSLLAAAERRLVEAGARRGQASVDDADERAVGFWGSTMWQAQPGQSRFTRNLR